MTVELFIIKYGTESDKISSCKVIVSCAVLIVSVMPAPSKTVTMHSTVIGLAVHVAHQ